MEEVETTTVRVVINKSSSDKYWYNDKIGETFLVEDFGVRDYYVKRDGFIVAGILKIDSEIIK